MSNFGNVTLGGALVRIDGADVGFTDGDIEIQREVEVKELEDGIPLTIVGQIPLSDKYKVKIPMVEATADNLSKASLNIPIEVTSGGTLTKVDGDDYAVTFGPDPAGSPFEVFELPVVNASGLVVENVAENVTYTNNTDYIMVTNAYGTRVFRNPAGAIASGATVRVQFTGTQRTSHKLPFGLNRPINNRVVEIIHTSPNDGRLFTFKFWKCQGKGSLNLSLKKKDWFKIDAEFNCLPHSSHPEAPIGYLTVEAAA